MTPKEQEDYDKEYTDNIRGIREHQQIGLTYLFHGFNKGVEGRTITRLSIQCDDSGSYKGFITAVKDMGEPSAIGLIAYTSNDSVERILEYFESGLAYGEIAWREDRYFKKDKSNEEDPNVKKRNKKIPL